MIRKILYVATIILLISVMIISSYFIYKELKQNNEQEDTFSELVQIVEDQTEEKDEENANIKELYEKNNDFIGWLKINDTNINYPVMQSKNNPNYYLKRDFYKKYSSYGTPYISEQCDINTSDNIIIYGHHMKNKQMFGSLEDYKSKKFYEKHQIIEFNTLEQNSKYEIFAVFKTVVYSDKGFRYYDYINFDNKNDFNNFISKCKELSLYETDKQPIYGNRLITLSTCEYSNKNGRLVVIGSKVTE